MTHIRTVGSKYQVWKGTALRTSGGLKKADIVQKRVGYDNARRKPIYRYLSKKKHQAGKAAYLRLMDSWTPEKLDSAKRKLQRKGKKTLAKALEERVRRHWGEYIKEAWTVKKKSGSRKAKNASPKKAAPRRSARLAARRAA